MIYLYTSLQEEEKKIPFFPAAIMRVKCSEMNYRDADLPLVALNAHTHIYNII